MKTLFVTGAEGFTGTHLVEYLRRRGYDVIAGVRNRARKLAFEKQNGKAVVCDVSDAINVARALAGAMPEGVIHLAGASQPHFANEEPLTAYQSIVTSWANVLDGVRRVVPRARVLLVSACDVYGNAGATPISESTPLNPATTFGSLKATAEQVAHTFFNSYHTNLTIVRPFHYTGPNQPQQFYFGAVAHRLTQWQPSDGDTLSLPDLECKRDLMHIDDLVEALGMLLEEGRPNEAYNVCSGTAHPVRELVTKMIAAASRNIRLEPLHTDEPPQVPVLCGSFAKLEELSGWRPLKNAEQAVTDLVRSHTPTPSGASV